MPDARRSKAQTAGEADNAILTAVGHNLRLAPLAEDSFAPDSDPVMVPARNPFRAQIGFLTDD